MRIIIIGGSAGLGEQIVAELNSEHEVLAMSRKSDYPLDLRWDERTIKMNIDAAVRRLGGLDALVVSSGMGIYTGPTISTDVLKDVLQVNCVGPIAVYRAVQRHLLRSKGKAIFISSTVSRKPGAGGLAYYAASKGAINSWVISESRRAIKHGVGLCVVSPGWFESPMTDEIKSELKTAITKAIPARRFGTANEVAKFTTNLLNQSNWCLAGQIFEVSGGA